MNLERDNKNGRQKKKLRGNRKIPRHDQYN